MITLKCTVNKTLEQLTKRELAMVDWDSYNNYDGISEDMFIKTYLKYNDKMWFQIKLYNPSLLDVLSDDQWIKLLKTCNKLTFSVLMQIKKFDADFISTNSDVFYGKQSVAFQKLHAQYIRDNLNWLDVDTIIENQSTTVLGSLLDVSTIHKRIKTNNCPPISTEDRIKSDLVFNTNTYDIKSKLFVDAFRYITNHEIEKFDDTIYYSWNDIIAMYDKGELEYDTIYTIWEYVFCWGL